MSWQLVRGPSGKVCFELDAGRGLIRIRHGRECTDIVDLTEYGLTYSPYRSFDGPNGGRVTIGPSVLPIDFSPEK